MGILIVYIGEHSSLAIQILAGIGGIVISFGIPTFIGWLLWVGEK